MQHQIHTCGSLKFLLLNVCGLRSRLKFAEFIAFVTSFDFIILVETKTDDLDASYFKEFFDEFDFDIACSNRKRLSFHRSGGLAVLYKKRFKQFVTFCEHENKNKKCSMWFTINKHLCGTDRDILAGAVYIPPEGSRYSNLDLFDELDNSIIDLKNIYCQNSHILLLGDFNAHTKTSNDFIRGNVFSEAFVSDLNGFPCDEYIPPPRFSYDKQKVNNYGYRLLELCKSH